MRHVLACSSSFVRRGTLVVWASFALLPAAVASPTPARIPFAAFVEQLQHDTCAALYGGVDDGAGAVCMENDLLATYRTDAAEHHADVQLCAAQGGVLVARIPACTEAMVTYLARSSAYELDDELCPVFEAYAAVASRCWGQWLCLE